MIECTPKGFCLWTTMTHCQWVKLELLSWNFKLRRIKIKISTLFLLWARFDRQSLMVYYPNEKSNIVLSNFDPNYNFFFLRNLFSAIWVLRRDGLASSNLEPKRGFFLVYIASIPSTLSESNLFKGQIIRELLNSISAVHWDHI